MMDRPSNRWYPAVLLGMILVGSFAASGWLAVVITGELVGVDSDIASFVLNRGPHQLMRVLMLMLALPFMPMLLRAMGWQGWVDSGHTADPTRRIDPDWWKDTLLGLAIGMASLGGMLGLGMMLGSRIWEPVDSTQAMQILATTAVIAALVAWLEETVARGILFRSLDRLWGLVPAVLVCSILFSILHTLKASPLAVGHGSTPEQTLSVLISALEHPIRSHAFVPRILNLTLMGVVLCLFVHRTRTIWVAVGTHAAWIWLHKLTDLVTHGATDFGGFWLGMRSGCLDSPATAGMLAILAGLGYRSLPCRGPEEEVVVGPLDIVNGPCRGTIHPDFAKHKHWLAEVEKLMASPAATLSTGRNQVVRLDAAGDRPAVVIKHFRAPGWPKSIADARIGSKAYRSWRTARHLEQNGVGTPQPVAWMDVRRGGRLRDSYLVSLFEADLTDLKQEVIRLYLHDPVCRKLMNLLECVAHSIRALHDAGVLHRDLGNQNIMLRHTGDGTYADAQFVDLNRARIKPFLTLVDRARDISRLHLPSELLRILVEMYFGGRPPEGFQVWERRYRTRYERHAVTRKYRHPIRRWRRKPPSDPDHYYPRPKDIWIWDDRSAQAINALRRPDRNRLHLRRDTLRQVASTARALLPVLGRYRDLLSTAYLQPVSLVNRIGISVEPPPGGEVQENQWLSELGPTPVLVRLYHHQGSQGWEAGMSWVERLAAERRPVAIALVQDRRAVTDPESWKRFVEQCLERLNPCVEWVEIGHAVNRVKWGIWSLREHRKLMAPVAEWRNRYPRLQIMGPAGIDFEYPYVLAALSGLPRGCRFDALSHHLYVDRRGAPENPQGPFALLEKCALARAIAGWSRNCHDRLIISETNWPLRGTGVWSPVVSPYDTPGTRQNDPSVDEESYAAFMIRYLLIALCSGMVERVYWWRLAARGFGLIDDTDPDAWRARPAYRVLSVFLQEVGQATFVARRVIGVDTHVYLFRRPDETRVVMAYSTVAGDSVRIPFAHGTVLDGFGHPCALPPALPGLPMYFQDPEGFALT